MEAIKRMEGLSILWCRDQDECTFLIPPYTMHTMLTFSTTTHMGTKFYDPCKWANILLTMEWELDTYQNFELLRHTAEDVYDMLRSFYLDLEDWKVLFSDRTLPDQKCYLEDVRALVKRCMSIQKSVEKVLQSTNY